MPPNTQRRSPRFVEKEKKKKTVKISEVEKLKEKLKKAQNELRATKKASRTTQKGQAELITELKDRLRPLLIQTLRAKTRAMHYHMQTCEQLLKLNKNNIELRETIQDCHADCEELCDLSDEDKTKQMIKKERKKSASFRKNMLKTQKLLRETQEKTDGQVKPWKSCEICGQEYDHSQEKSPRVMKCGHTLCSTCIIQISESERIRCPFDRLTTYLTNGVESLPKNFIVLQM